MESRSPPSWVSCGDIVTARCQAGCGSLELALQPVTRSANKERSANCPEYIPRRAGTHPHLQGTVYSKRTPRQQDRREQKRCERGANGRVPRAPHLRQRSVGRQALRRAKFFGRQKPTSCGRMPLLPGETRERDAYVSGLSLLGFDRARENLRRWADETQASVERNFAELRERYASSGSPAGEPIMDPQPVFFMAGPLMPAPVNIDDENVWRSGLSTALMVCPRAETARCCAARTLTSSGWRAGWKRGAA